MLIAVPILTKIKQGFLCLAQMDKLARAERTLLHKGEWVHGTSHPIQMSYLHDIMPLPLLSILPKTMRGSQV